MPQPIPQRVITVTLVGNDEKALDCYTYWSPMTGQIYTNSPTCEMVDDQPIYSLFLLDYFSTLNGWTVTGLEPVEKFACPDFKLGPNDLSIATADPYITIQTYRYSIGYANSVTGVKILRDPQQGNIPKPAPR